MTPTLPASTEPSFLDWLQYVGDNALKTWVRDRLAEPAEHVVYLRRLSSGALYCGIARLDRLKTRMREHSATPSASTCLTRRTSPIPGGTGQAKSSTCRGA